MYWHGLLGMGSNVTLANLPWIQAAQGLGPDDDLLVMDDAVACAIDKFGADLRRMLSLKLMAAA